MICLHRLVARYINRNGLRIPYIIKNIPIIFMSRWLVAITNVTNPKKPKAKENKNDRSTKRPARKRIL